LVVRVHEGPPGAVFIAVEPFRFRRHAPRLLMVDVSTKMTRVDTSTKSPHKTCRLKSRDRSAVRRRDRQTRSTHPMEHTS
jgi:hypothetical protein